MNKERFGTAKMAEAGEIILKLRDENKAQAQEIERLNAEIKTAFWWSAEFTRIIFDNRIQEAWEEFLAARERQAKESVRRASELKSIRKAADEARREQND